MRSLKAIAESYGIDARHVMEIGVGHPENCAVADWIPDNCVRVTLVEPNPHIFSELHQKWGDRPNVLLRQCAAYWRQSRVTLYMKDQLSFVHGEKPPIEKIEGYQPTRVDGTVVDAVPMKDLDDGTVDVMLIDTEGSELYPVRDMVSRPKLVCVEMIAAGGYTNPHTTEIYKIMDARGYNCLGSFQDFKDYKQNVFWLLP